MFVYFCYVLSAELGLLVENRPVFFRGRNTGEVQLPSELYGWHCALVPKFGRKFPGFAKSEGGRESEIKKNTTRVQQGEINRVLSLSFKHFTRNS